MRNVKLGSGYDEWYDIVITFVRENVYIKLPP